ncbi:WhiB family transcriptional regulator [Actinomyces culturomici]|uniref:WhiB family transcriptional regulator n=1 Tax=Actinomyces culturomici TaxID=1926276 RepID=UPI000E2096DB|nr:WhiB family transcriptional regulator [Actinomyces culturomici]
MPKPTEKPPAEVLRQLNALKALSAAHAIPDDARPAYRWLSAALDALDQAPPCNGLEEFTVERKWRANDGTFNGADYADAVDMAARICARCPVLDECRAYGIANPREFGIWGGLDRAARRTLADADEQQTA